MENWDSFNFRLDFAAETLQEELNQIEAYRLSLNRLILPQEWKQDLQRLFIIRTVHGTTAIEGNPLSEKDVELQLTSRGKARYGDQVHRQTANAEKAFRWVESHFAKNRRVTLADLLTIHETITRGSDEGDNVPGRLRESGHQVTVGSPLLGGVHRAPPGGKAIRSLVEQFLEFINSRQFGSQPIVIQALVAHFYFVTLHPFGNGNGRTTRCLEAAILHGGGYNTYGFYSLSNYFYRNRDDYFRLLQETRTKHRYDLTTFLRFGLRGFLEELERINAYVRNRIHRLQYRELIRRGTEQRVGKRRLLLNDREARLLHAILDASEPRDPFSEDPSGETSLREVESTVGVLYRNRTARTLARDLERLEDLGFVHIQRHESSANWRLAVNFAAIGEY